MVAPAVLLLTITVTLATVPRDVQAAPTDPSVEARCQKDRKEVFPHPKLCQLYYNCSNDASRLRMSPFEKYMQECPYPQLFDVDTLSCKAYMDVDCGNRTELVDACNYLSNRCVTARCKPCPWSYPSCNGLEDGLNMFPAREWSAWFVDCLDNRTVSTGYCRPNYTLRENEIFSPDRGQCVSLYEVPREHGGKPLNCTEKADGLHPDDVTFKPDLYFRCNGGQLMEIAVCPSEERFDKASQQCVSS